MVSKMGRHREKRLCYDADFNGIHTSCFKSIAHIFRYHKSSDNIVFPRPHQGRRLYTSVGIEPPETISVRSESHEGRDCLPTKPEPILVLDAARVSFWAKEMRPSGKTQKDLDPFGDPIIIFRERDSKLLEDRSGDLILDKARDEQKCQVCGSVDLVDKDSEFEKLSLENPRDPVWTRIRNSRITRSGSFPVLITHKHKETEFWSFSDARKGLLEEPVLPSPGSPKTNSDSSSSTCLVHKLDRWGLNRLLSKRFNSLKQRLKFALSPKDRILGREFRSIPASNLGRVNNQQEDVSSNMKGIESSSDQQRSRLFSLDESLERYAKLFGNQSTPDAKLEHSTSLRLRRKSIYRRQLSLPDLEIFRFHLRNADYTTDNPRKSTFDAFEVDSGNKGSSTVESNSAEDSEISIKLEQEPKHTDIESCMDGNERSVNAPSSEVGDFDPHNNGGISPSGNVKITNGGDSMENLVRSYYKLDKKDEASFNFVRALLELSSLLGVQGKTSIRASTDHHLLNPSLLDDLEIFTLYEPDSCSRKLLFDLVNESIAEIQGRPITCVPRLSESLKLGILEEVWKRVCWYKSMISGLDLPLDDVIAHDMKSGSDRWMDVRVEIEDIGLELGDWIFDDLLDEELLLGY